jgi:hypothetical protein
MLPPFAGQELYGPPLGRLKTARCSKTAIRCNWIWLRQLFAQQIPAFIEHVPTSEAHAAPKH